MSSGRGAELTTYFYPVERLRIYEDTSHPPPTGTNLPLPFILDILCEWQAYIANIKEEDMLGDFMVRLMIMVVVINREVVERNVEYYRKILIIFIFLNTIK